MNKDLTLVFSSYQSHNLLNKILKKFNKIYKIIIIENSCDHEIKNHFEKKFKNIKVIIPNKNLGLAASYNLGLKCAKTEFVFLNNPDLNISLLAISQLLECAKKIKNFGIMSPVYKNEKIYKNYENNFNNKKLNTPIGRKYNICEVDLIDNSFFVNRKKALKNKFDENFFLYFETFDFSKNLKKKGFKLFVAQKIKFHHIGSSSLPKKYSNLVNKTRSFHYTWSKFYYFKKNFNYIFAFKKIIPNIVKSKKRLLKSFFMMDFYNLHLSLLELKGICYSMLNIKSSYRPKN